MDEDIFENNHFYLSYHGFDFKKNGIKKEHIDFSDIEFIEVKKGRSIKHWLFITFLGLIICGAFLHFIIQWTEQINFSEITYQRGVILAYIGLYVLFFLGLSLIITALIKFLNERVTMKVSIADS
jgi:hypothetical protein